jgi:hypothetical protein
MKKYIIIIITLLLTGCNYNELNDIGLVSLINVEYKDNMYKTTLEIINTNKDNNKVSDFITATSSSFEESLQIIKSNYNLDPNYSHIYAIIVDDNILNNKLDEIINYLTRSTNIRKDILLYTSSNNFLKEYNDTNKLSIGEKIYNINKNQKINGSLYITSNLRDIIHLKLNNEPYIISDINLKDNNILYSKKLYILDKNYKQKIDKKYMLLFNLIKKNINSFYIKDNKSNYEIYNYTIKTLVNENSIDIYLNLDAKILSTNKNINTAKEIKVLEKKLSKKIKNELYKSINYSKRINSDIYGINLYYNKNKYKNIKYNIKIKTNINEKGLSLWKG